MNELAVMTPETVRVLLEEVVKDSNQFNFNVLNLLIAIFALGVSIWTVYSTSKKTARGNYRKTLYDDLLKDKLQKLPQIIQKGFNAEGTSFNKKELDKFETLIGELRSNILIFEYIDKKLYKELDKITKDIDDKIVLIINKGERVQERYKEILKLVTKLYKIIEKRLFK